MGTVARTIGAIAVLFALSGCVTGTDFAKPTLDSLNLGGTKRADIVASYGEPRSEAASTFASADVKPTENQHPMNGVMVPGSFNQLRYVYQDRSETFLSGRVKNKFMIFTLWNDALVGYDFSSDFPDDSSDFDSSKVSTFTTCKTTKQEVLDILGVPTGRAVYPAILRQGDEKWIYSYLGTRDGKILDKGLEVLFDSHGVVADFRMAENSKPAPVPQAAPAPIPIFIPSK